MKIELHIEALVLDGVPLARHEHARLQAAVVEALTQQLGDGTTTAHLAKGGERDVVRAAPVRLSARPDVRALGAQIAASIHASLGVGATQGSASIPKAR